MKKLAIGPAVIAWLALVGCGGDTPTVDPAGSHPASSVSASAQSRAVYMSGEILDLGSCEVAGRFTFRTPPGGSVFLDAAFTRAVDDEILVVPTAGRRVNLQREPVVEVELQGADGIPARYRLRWRILAGSVHGRELATGESSELDLSAAC